MCIVMYGVCLIVIGIDIIIIRYYNGYGGWSWWLGDMYGLIVIIL